MTGGPSEEILRKVKQTRAAQGLPPTITDPAAIERIAAVFRLIKSEPGGEDARAAAG